MITLQEKWDARLIKLFYTLPTYFVGSQYMTFLKENGFLEKDKNGEYLKPLPELKRTPRLKCRKDVIGFLVSELPMLYELLQKHSLDDSFDIVCFLQQSNWDCKKESNKKYFSEGKKTLKKAQKEARAQYLAYKGYRTNAGLSSRSAWNIIK